MFIVKKKGGSHPEMIDSDNSMSPEIDISYLDDFEKVILGDTVKLSSEDNAEIENYIGKVIYNDTELLLLEPLNEKLENRLTLYFKNNELESIYYLNTKIPSSVLSSIVIIEKAKSLGYVKLHNLNINDKIKIITESSENECHNFQGEIYDIKNDSIWVKNDLIEQETLEIHFNYKGISPESGIISIDKVSDSNVGQIIYLNDGEVTSISDYEDINENEKMYTLSEQSNDYIQTRLSKLKIYRHKKEMKNIARELDYWFELIGDYNENEKPYSLLEDYKSDLFSDETVIPIMSDHRKLILIDIDNGGDDIEQDGYTVVSQKKMVSTGNKLLNMQNEDTPELYKNNLTCEEDERDFWKLNNTYSPNDDIENVYRNIVGKNTLVLRDSLISKTCYSYNETGNMLADVLTGPIINESKIKTRIISGPSNNTYNGKQKFVGEEYTMTGYLKLPYIYRKSVDLTEGIYTIEDVEKSDKYIPISKIIEKDGYIKYNKNLHKPEDVEVGDNITVCINDINETFKLAGELVDIDEMYLYLKPNDNELYQKKNIWKIKKEKLSVNDVIKNIDTTKKLCNSEYLEKANLFSFTKKMNSEEKNRYLEEYIIPSVHQIVLSQANLLSKCVSVSDIDKVLHYYKLRFRDIPVKQREILEKYLQDNNKYLIDLVKYNKEELKKYLVDRSMNIFSGEKNFKISNKIIRQLEADYGKYQLFDSIHDSDSSRIRWLLSGYDGGMLYYLKFLINTDINDDEIKQKLEKLSIDKIKLHKYLESSYTKDYKKEDCNDFKIVKYYFNQEDLEKDNGKEVYYDAYLDSTPRYILTQVDSELNAGKELESSASEELRKDIAQRLQRIDGYENTIWNDEVVSDVLIGGKIVKLYDKCLLKDELDMKYHIYIRQRPAGEDNEKWVLDEDGRDIKGHVEYCQNMGMKIENISLEKVEQCNFDKETKQCVSSERGQEMEKIRMIQRVLKQIDEEIIYYGKIDDYKKEIQKETQKIKKLIRFRKENCSNVLHYKISDSVKITDVKLDDDVKNYYNPIFTAIEGFDEGGNPIITAEKENMKEEIVFNINKDSIYLDKEKVYYNHIRTWLQISNIILSDEKINNMVKNVSAYMANEKMVKTFNAFRKILKDENNKHEELVDRYIDYTDRELVYAICCFSLIEIQTSIPQVEVAVLYPKCKVNVYGYPLDKDETNLSSIEYISCLLFTYLSFEKKIRNIKDEKNRTIWSILSNEREGELVERFKKKIDLIMDNYPGIQSKYELKRENMKNAGILKIDYSIQKKFLPPVEEHISNTVSLLEEKHLEEDNINKYISSVNNNLIRNSYRIMDNINKAYKNDTSYGINKNSKEYSRELSDDLVEIYQDTDNLSEKKKGINQMVRTLLVNLDPKTVPEMTEIMTKLPQADEEELLYILLMNYSSDGKKRLVNEFGRCVISGEQSEAFLVEDNKNALLKEAFMKSGTMEKSEADTLVKNMNRDIHLKKRKQLLEEFPVKSVQEFIQKIRKQNIINISDTNEKKTDTELDTLIEEVLGTTNDPNLEKLRQSLENSKNLEGDILDKKENWDDIWNNISEITNEYIEEAECLVGIKDLLKNLGKQTRKMDEMNNLYENMDTTFNYHLCMNDKMLERNLKSWYNFIKVKTDGIIHNKLVFDNTVISSKWGLSDKHKEELQKGMEEDYSYLQGYSIKCNENGVMKDAFIYLSDEIKKYSNMHNIHGICYELDYQYISYTNILIKYMIVKMLLDVMEDKTLEDDEEYDIDEEKVNLDNRKMLREYIKNVMIDYQKTMERNNIDSVYIDTEWEKMAEIDKQRIIKKHDKKSEEEKEVNMVLKEAKLGSWAKGLSSSVWKYDATSWDQEAPLEENPVDNDINTGVEDDQEYINEEDMTIDGKWDNDDEMAELNDELDGDDVWVVEE